ncbi:MAG: hypothetical protein ABR599_09595 [Gemmatimonadota bacterium]
MPPFLIPMYIGPETILPLTSILGAAAGFLLMFWQRVVAFAKGALRLVSRKKPTGGSEAA